MCAGGGERESDADADLDGDLRREVERESCGRFGDDGCGSGCGSFGETLRFLGFGEDDTTDLNAEASSVDGNILCG